MILLVAKTPLAGRLEEKDIVRLAASGAGERHRLEEAARRHEEALATVRAALAGEALRELRVERLSPADGQGADLVVTVGGDGTVFTANTLATSAPFLTVNSDPERSIGHYTRCLAPQVATALAAWRDGTTRFESVPRLEARIADQRWRFLNDCLFTSQNPAALTRYLLEEDGRQELQRSSGVWVSTAEGSTGAIRSAGATPVPAGSGPALLWRVREPFQGREPVCLREGRQLPPRGLRLTPSLPHLALYLDGPNITVPLQPGLPVAFAASDQPLRLLLP